MVVYCMQATERAKNAVSCPWWPWPLTFKLVHSRDQNQTSSCESGANPFSGSRDILYTNKKSHTDCAKNGTFCSSLHAVMMYALLSPLLKKNCQSNLGHRNKVVGWFEFNVPFQHKYGHHRCVFWKQKGPSTRLLLALRPNVLSCFSQQGEKVASTLYWCVQSQKHWISHKLKGFHIH